MQDRNAVVRVPIGAPGKVSYTDTAGTGTAAPENIKNGVTAVLVWCTTIAYVTSMDGLTATTANGTPLPAGGMAVLPSDGTAPSAIRDATSGTMYYRYLL